MTYDEIAKALGISKTRVIQLERAAIAKLRKSKAFAAIYKDYFLS